MEIKEIYKIDNKEFENKQAAEAYLNNKNKFIELNYDSTIVDFLKENFEWFEIDYEDLKKTTLFELPSGLEDLCKKIENQSEAENISVHYASLYNVLFESLQIGAILNYVKDKKTFINITDEEYTKVYKSISRRLVDSWVPEASTACSVIDKFISFVEDCEVY